MSKAFDTHPITGDRTRRAQAEISALLPNKTECVVDNGAIRNIKTRLAPLIVENAHPVLHCHDPEEDTPTARNVLRRGD